MNYSLIKLLVWHENTKFLRDSAALYTQRVIYQWHQNQHLISVIMTKALCTSICIRKYYQRHKDYTPKSTCYKSNTFSWLFLMSLKVPPPTRNERCQVVKPTKFNIKLGLHAYVKSEASISQRILSSLGNKLSMVVVNSYLLSLSPIGATFMYVLGSI